MFSSTLLHAFVCLALGIAVGAAPTGTPGGSIDARSPDVYDTTGGIAGLLLGLDGETYGGDNDEDVYILKRDDDGVEARFPDTYDASGSLAGLLYALGGDRHAAGNGDVYILERDGGEVEARSPDVYDGSGGIASVLLGLDRQNYGGDDDVDSYILKRDASEVEARSPDVYDGSGGIAALLLGLDGERSEGDSDEDLYILKRQLAGLGIDENAASLLNGDVSSISTTSDMSTEASGSSAIGSGFDASTILSSFGGSAGANANLASSFGLENQ